MKTINSADLIYSGDGNKVFCSRGDLALGYKISYPEKYSQGQSDFETIQATWVRALKNLPQGTIVIKSDIYTSEEFDASNLPNVTYLQKATNNHFEGRSYLKHIGYIFFVFTRINTLKNESIKNPFLFPKIAQFDKDDIEIKNFISEVEEAAEIVKTSGSVSLNPLNEKEITSYLDFYFNGFQSMYLTDFKVEADHFSVDDKITGVFSIQNEKHFPDNISPAIEDKEFSSSDRGFTFYQGFLDSLGVDLGIPHMYNQIIFVDDHKYHVNKIHKNFINLQAASRISPENKAGSVRLESYLNEVASDSNYHFIRGHNNVVFWADSKIEFEYRKKKIAALLKSCDFKPVYLTGERMKSVFYNTFFANTSCMDDDSLFLADLRIATCLFVTNTNYKDDPEGIIFTDRIFNIPVVHDFWSENNKARKVSRNFAIIAETGRGKSFFAQHLFRQLIDDGVIVVIIDLGDSYLKLSKLFPPEDVLMVKYKEGEPLGLNPFSLAHGEEISSTKIEELCQFVWTLIKKGEEPESNEDTSLRKIIKDFYVKEEVHKWETFYYFIKNNRDTLLEQCGIEDSSFFDIDAFLHAGSDFIGDGIYASLFRFEGDSSANFLGKKLIIFELDAIQDNKLILTVMLQVISEAISKTIWNDRSKRGVVFYDEFAKQLEFPEVLKRVKYQAQAIRKQNGALGIVLQTLNQMPNTPEGNTIIDNTETKIFLQGNNYTPSITRLELNEHDVSQLNSLASKMDGERRYSEFYMKISNNFGNVFRVEVPREVFLAYQTEGALHDAMMKRYDEVGDMMLVIEEFKNKTL